MSNMCAAMFRLLVCRFLLGWTSEALSARRASQTKRSLPLRTTAVIGSRMMPSPSKTADKSGKYSVRIASCKATLEVEITLGSFIRSGRCICQRMQATRYARVLPVPTPASHREISLLYKVSKTSWQSAICSSRTAMLCRGKISRKIFSAIRWDSV